MTAFSCEDIVDIEPQFAQDAESYFQTEQDYENALIGAYDMIGQSFLSLWLGEIASDNSIAGGESPNDTRSLHEIDEMVHTPESELELRRHLRFMYSGITRTNFIFEFKDNLNFERKDELLAEASFLRAYYYFQLVKVFGDVPLVVDRRLSIDEATSLARTPKEEVYAQIETDLIAAAEGLQWTSPVKGRVTKGAALGLLGRAYIYQDKFDEAAIVLDELISDGPYSLITVSTSGEYVELFSVAQEGNSESVFEIQHTGQEGSDFVAPQAAESNWAIGFHSPKNYEGPVYDDGNSYNLPTEELYNSFAAGDIRRDGAILNLIAWETSNPTVSYDVGTGGFTGYYNHKYMRRANELGAGDERLTSPRNHRVLRLPEVLLMAAEAHNRKAAPNDAQAQMYLNMVRSRLGLADVNASGTALTDAIWQERRWETAGEGLRFFDLVRTGQAEAAIDGFVVGKHEVFPIPRSEIDLSGGAWRQNDNY
ncbi:RagB/SusD family nutrient uptake outer membrane protein [Ekhidna sp.]